MASNDLGGVWRTVGGRRIFIKDGEDLETAMKKSGKFKKSKIKDKNDDKKNKKMTDEEREKKIKELEKKKEETVGFLQKAGVDEEIRALKAGYDDVKKYRKAEEERKAKISADREKEKARQEETRIKKAEEYKDNDYKMAHRPDEEGATGDDITKGEIAMPKDFYSKPDNYFNMNKKENKESFEVLKKIKDNPNAEVTIYRATTGDSINDGDWITLSKTYAEIHNDSNLDGKGKILSMKVKANEIKFAGDDINEFGYFPKSSGKDFSSMSRQQLATLLVENQIDRGIIKPESKQRQIQARLTGSIKMSKDALIEYAKKYLK